MNKINSENGNDEEDNFGNEGNSCDTPSILSKSKLENVNGSAIRHLNVNYLPGKFDQLKVIIIKTIDILLIR